MQHLEQNKNIKPVIIIPSRLNSTRLPRKALEIIDGKPMIWHVWSNAIKADIAPVLVATDSNEIKDIIIQNGGNAILTDKKHASGSDRIYEALNIFDQKKIYNFVINLQGDMPFFPSNLFETILSNVTSEDLITLVCPATEKEVTDPNVVKAVVSWDSKIKNFGNALYFSRSKVPYNSDEYWHHIGIYGWKRDRLKKFVLSKPTQLELMEKLEQLRVLENNMKIKVVKIEQNLIGVDTMEDLYKMRKLIEKSES